MKIAKSLLSLATRSITRTAMVAFGAFLAFSMVTAPSALATGDSTPEPLYSESLSAEENELLNSEEPTRVYLDSYTGEVLKVERDSLLIKPMTAFPNDCSGGRACWYPWSTPVISYGFSGPGVTTGAWSYRGHFYTNMWPATHCWEIPNTFNRSCSNEYPPYTTVYHSRDVDGYRVTLG